MAMTLSALPLDDAWRQRLDLAGRDAPDLYESLDSVRDTPHAAAIRATLDGLGASGVFCVQGVPTVVIASLERYERERVVALHAALWNQGLASLLVVLTEDIVRVFSLSRTPYSNPGDEFERRCLVETLTVSADALALKGIVYGVESGRFWEEHAKFFNPRERVDSVLLENLTRSHALLVGAGLDPDAAQALLIQTMFIAYLEDREIVGPDYFEAASGRRAKNLVGLLRTGEVARLEALFSALRIDFNGDLFVAPCSFEPDESPPIIGPPHLHVLSRFRDGHEEMGAGQMHFWGYDFKHIPIELISAVYDRFLGEREAERRERGAYYTPMFLADTVVTQVWDALPDSVREKGEFLDPACGSGIFLVRSFQRLCEHWRQTRTSTTIRWTSLLSMLSRVRGFDLNPGAVRVAVFSLYIALLEQVNPPDIRQLIKKGNVLPEVWGKTLVCRDFFAVDATAAKVDVVIGNPPWTSRRGPSRSSITWCAERKLPMPLQEDAWAFTWKAMLHLRSDGCVAFLLPAMGFLHNHSDVSVAARSRLIATARVRRVVNFADLRFQLFDGAVRAAALIIFGPAPAGQPAYRFDYWAPKADLNLKVKRLITLSSADKSFITSKAAKADPLIFKRRLWMSEPEGKLFNYLSGFTRLDQLVAIFGDVARGTAHGRGWVLGDGFKQAVAKHIGKTSYNTVRSDYVGVLPHIKIEDLPPLAIAKPDLDGAPKWQTRTVHRRGFEAAYTGDRVLIPRGVQVGRGRLRAAYCVENCTFSSIIQGLTVPAGEETRGKLLTALLNSRVLMWFAFHETASLGSDRPEIQKSELVRLPFPRPEEMPEPLRAQRAADGLVETIDRALNRPGFALDADPDDIFPEIDKLAYDYFCLSPEEIALIEDAARFILPAIQPHQGSLPAIWRGSTRRDRVAYAQVMTDALAAWFGGDHPVGARLEAHNDDLAVLKLKLDPAGRPTPYAESSDSEVRDLLAKIFKNVHQPLPGNFQLMPDFRVFDGNSLYLVKPMQLRFWLRSAALSDADAIALDLQDFAGLRKKQEGVA
ncbi:N-6 DNA methylase [Mesorhizobium sp. M1A.F.Ca.IN.020.06.1.1]|nr:N-6 DNA methylase [Mesorhizobium sp. M1A.F.Ca.IN.020.32.1.1]RUW28686.1 N-6 DNA methylase [Mesorhizobium sp. M1A.F.Ca.IN.020.06.1.1]RWF85042.1 MAG: N-6 DNA methylase [Mesorhizobium sp.]RWF93879.1 MAG: N-6 DNA methylase [Mesorhizobium sp.]RWG78915.1 MAG: N-6 DNA methylase [Mesorhizobium sp.]